MPAPTEDSSASPRPQSPQNGLLAALSPEERERLGPGLETVSLTFKQPLHEPDRPVEHVYFPHTGVASLLKAMADGRAVEIATVGPEGMVGLPVLFGAETMPSRALCQIPGDASRMTADAFRRAVQASPPFHALLMRYAQALFNQMAQTAACNRLHSIEERCARWMLMTQDRVNGSTCFPLTQEFLAQMLGVRRPSVSVAASTLQRAGLIRYTRGSVTVLDRAGLEVAACECYGAIRREFERLVGVAG